MASETDPSRLRTEALRSADRIVDEFLLLMAGLAAIPALAYVGIITLADEDTKRTWLMSAVERGEACAPRQSAAGDMEKLRTLFVAEKINANSLLRKINEPELPDDVATTYAGLGKQAKALQQAYHKASISYGRLPAEDLRQAAAGVDRVALHFGCSYGGLRP